MQHRLGSPTLRYLKNVSSSSVLNILVFTLDLFVFKELMDLKSNYKRL